MENKILIVDSNYYPEVSVNLVQGSKEYLNNHNIKSVVIKAPGAFEIPFLINKKKDFFDGFIALGCIIRGQTYHFEIISNGVARKIMDLSININKPIGFGILTCDNFDQALERADPNIGNKGAEAAKACVDLLDLR